MDWRKVGSSFQKVVKLVLSYVLFAILYPLCFLADTDRSKLRPEIQVSFNFLSRVLILEVGLLVLDIGSDFANGGKFILDGHAVVGTLTIAMVFLPGLIRAITILDLYRQGKLDLSRVGLEADKYTRTDLVLTLTRVFLARVLFFPILPITMFLKSLFSTSDNDFEKDFQFGITDKFLESFSEAGPQMLITLTVLLKSPGSFQASKISLLAVASSTFSVAKTASEGHVMFSSTKIPKIRQWLPLLPYFLLTTLTRGLSIALFIAYAGLFYSFIPLFLLFLSGIGLAKWVAQGPILQNLFATTTWPYHMPSGMVILNSGLSSLLSSQHFSTVPLATPKSNLRTLKFLTFNTLASFVIISASYAALIVTLNIGNVLTFSADDVPFFSCYIGNSSSNTFFCDLNIATNLTKAADATVSHAMLFTIALPFLLFLWLLCIVYALLIFPARIFFSETYLHDDDDGVVNEKSISPSDWMKRFKRGENKTDKFTKELALHHEEEMPFGGIETSAPIPKKFLLLKKSMSSDPDSKRNPISELNVDQLKCQLSRPLSCAF